MIQMIPPSDSAASADVQATLALALRAIEQVLTQWRLPGLVVGVTDRHQLRGVVAHGYADLKVGTPLTVDARFAIGSISKSFTAMALLQLAAEGRLDLHAPIARYLPGLTLHSPFAPISVHHLLSHTSGLPFYLMHAASSRYAVAALQDFTPVYAPGTHFWYSNTGYQLLGYVLEDLEGVPYPSLMQRRILRPLGMDSTAAVIDDAERTRMVTSYTRRPSDGTYLEASWFEYAGSDGSLISTVPDMCAYARCILNGGAGPKGWLLSETEFAAWTTPILDQCAYGLFVKDEGGSTVVGHDGGIAGFHSSLEVRPHEGVGSVMLSNSPVPAELKQWMAETVAVAFRGAPLPVAPVPAEQRKLDDYAGVYQLTPNLHSTAPTHRMLECVMKEGCLWVKQGGTLQPVERMGGEGFRVAGPESDGLPFFFGRAEDRTDAPVTEVSHGTQWYVKQGSVEPTTPSPERDYSAYVGHFENPGPEGPVVRVFVRRGRLCAMLSLSEGVTPIPLEPLGPDTFRMAWEPGKQAHSPERVRFDTVRDGHALRMTLSGVPLYRKDTP